MATGLHLLCAQFPQLLPVWLRQRHHGSSALEALALRGVEPKTPIRLRHARTWANGDGGF